MAQFQRSGCLPSGAGAAPTWVLLRNITITMCLDYKQSSNSKLQIAFSIHHTKSMAAGGKKKKNHPVK